MAGFLGNLGTQKVKPIIYKGLNVSSSQRDMPIPIFWGQRKMPTNAIWYNNFKKKPVSAGGKGGGKGASEFDYTAAVILGLCEGPVDSIVRVWANGSTTTFSTLSALNLTLFTGTASQAPWSFVTTNYPTQARAYAYTAYLVCPKMDLGTTASVPDNQFETVRKNGFSFTVTSNGFIDPTTLIQDTNSVDVMLSDVIYDWLTNTQYGMLWSAGDIGDMSQYVAYMRAQGLFYSPILDRQEKGTEVLNRYAQISNAWIYWSGTQIQFVPLGDSVVTGNSVTYTPQDGIAYTLGPSDFIDPLKVSRLDPADVKNRTILNIIDRTLGYISNPLEYKDDSLVDDFGIKDNSSVQGGDICNPVVGAIVVQLIGKRAAYIRNTYSFTTSYRFIRCLPGTILQLNEPNIGLTNVRVRVVSIDEDDKGQLKFECEEYPGTIGTYTASSVPSPGTATTPDQLADPGNVNTPAITEPSSAFTSNAPQLLIAASGGVNWGGTNVYVSFDGTNYSFAGKITAPAPQGTLTGNLANHADPDTINTLAVDCTESDSTLSTAITNADADADRTLSLVVAQPTFSGGIYHLPNNGELLAYGATSATGTYTANLTYLRRGQYGTSASSHSTGDQFTQLDPLDVNGSTLFYNLPTQYIGQTLYFKFTSFNLFNQATQDISAVNEYSYIPTGLGYGTASGGLPQTPTGLAATGLVQSALVTWAANPTADNVTQYLLYRAPGTGASFGSAVLIYTANALTYLDSGLAANTGYTYFLIAQNAAGLSSHTVGVSVTTATAQINIAVPVYTCVNIGTKPLNAVIGRYPAAFAWTLPSVAHGGTVAGKVDTAPGADTTFNLLKNGSNVAQVKFASGSTTPTLINASDVSFAFDDYIDLQTPSSLNGMTGVFGISLLGSR